MAGAKDVITAIFDGTNLYAQLSKAYALGKTIN
jgi:hypothetical protein